MNTAPDASAVAGASGELTAVAFDDHYFAHSWVHNSCDRWLRMAGSEPAESGTFPVAIFLVGTDGKYDYPGILDNVVPSLARHGFVAASLEYEDGTLFGAAQNCDLYGDNAACMVRNDDDYVGGNRSSAVARLCGRAKADCSKGVVFVGHSQGGLTSLQAFRFAPAVPPSGDPLPRLVAAAPMGVGNRGYAIGLPLVDLSSCMDAANIALDKNHLLVVNGENDHFFGGPRGDQAGGQIELEAVTGRTCIVGSLDCRLPNGSGYLFVKGAQVSSGFAGHEYMSIQDHSFGEPNWISPTNAEPWTLASVTKWLRAQTTP